MARVSRSSVVFHILGWVAAAVLSALVLNRLWRTETVPILIGLQGVTQWALLPAFVVAALALWRRKRALAAVAIVLSAAQLFWALGAVGWHGPQSLPASALPLRLVTANVLYTNEHIRELGDDLAAEDADIVVVQEVTDEVLVELQRSDLWSDYAFRSTAPQALFLGAATFSRFPIVNEKQIDVAGNPMLLTDLRTPAGTVRVINVHTVAPLTEVDAPAWAAQFAVLAGLMADSPYPTILAGDFNATLDHAPLEGLASGDVRDAFRVAGAGIGNTWPRWELPIPPVMRLDHVLVSSTIDVKSLVDQLSIGSDHRRLVAELGITRAE